ESAGYGEVVGRFGSISASAALRLDAAGAVATLSPRVLARWTIARRIELSSAFGRTSRLYHLVGDARSEPDFDFLDFWLGGGSGVPTARVDHATLDLHLNLVSVVARVSAYASRGSGIGELRPEHDQTSDFFRFGKSQTHGLEAQLAYRGSDRSPRSFSVTYVYAASQRDWGSGWVRWAQDRRHQFRGFGQVSLGRGAVFGALEAATGTPITPIEYWVNRAVPTTLGRAPNEGLVPVYGRENIGS